MSRLITVDEPHQICSYTLLFLLFHYFLYIVNLPLCTPTPMWLHAIALTSSDWSCLFDGHMFYDSHVSFLFLVSPTCTLPWSDQSWALAPHGQALTIASLWINLMLSFLLTIHISLTCIYLSRQTIYPYKFPPELRFSTYISHRITSHSPCTISHCITLPHSPTVFTCYTTPGDDPLPPDHTLRAT